MNLVAFLSIFVQLREGAPKALVSSEISFAIRTWSNCQNLWAKPFGPSLG